MVNPDWFNEQVDWDTSCIDVSVDSPARITLTGYMRNASQHYNCLCATETNSRIVNTPKIKRVIHNDPATIVFWADGTKTVVKCWNEPYDAEKGIAMAVCKKLFGKEYHKIFRKLALG